MLVILHLHRKQLISYINWSYLSVRDNFKLIILIYNINNIQPLFKSFVIKKDKLTIIYNIFYKTLILKVLMMLEI